MKVYNLNIIFMHTTYLHRQLHYFFSPSEHIDLSIGTALASTLPLPLCLDRLEQSPSTLTLDAALATLGHILTLSRTGKLSMHRQNAQYFYSNDGLKVSIFALKNYLVVLKSRPASIGDEMAVKTLINLLYVGIMYWHQSSSFMG